jgi:hypothetical protein
MPTASAASWDRRSAEAISFASAKRACLAPSAYLCYWRYRK